MPQFFCPIHGRWDHRSNSLQNQAYIASWPSCFCPSGFDILHCIRNANIRVPGSVNHEIGPADWMPKQFHQTFGSTWMYSWHRRFSRRLRYGNSCAGFFVRYLRRHTSKKVSFRRSYPNFQKSAKTYCWLLPILRPLCWMENSQLLLKH